MSSPKPLRARAYCPRCRAASDLEGDRLRGPWTCACGEAREIPGPSDTAGESGPEGPLGRRSVARREGGSHTGSEHAPAAGGAPGTVVRRCAFCGCASLYIEKDFHQGLGCLAMIVLPTVIAIVLPWPLGISLPISLMTVTAIDAVLFYAVVPFRTVCYACCAEHRGGTMNPEHKGYDLVTAELFQERVGGPSSRSPGMNSGPPDRQKRQMNNDK